jgi:type II secretory ATPase GspE/PulE/Tfp pilus assembly ATPase PilB-like protein
MNLDPIYSGLDEEQRQALVKLPRGERLIEIATLRNRPTRELRDKLAELAELPVAKDIELIENPTAAVPLRMIHEYQCIPIKTEEDAEEDAEDDAEDDASIQLATLWPPDELMDRWVYAVSGRKAQWFIGDPEQITETITQNFGVGAGSLDESNLVTDVAETEEAEDEDAAVIRFVNEVVQKAVSDRATDIHFEPHREELQIRYRIDGELVPVRVPDNLIRFQGAIISRLKIMAKLNISEKRRPQDGRISFGAGDSELDIRISTFPTMYGESVSLRLLNQKSKPLSMRELGLSDDEEKKVTQALSTPHGIILVTGPTGSGKSTSLTAFIRLINRPERRIITVEDPVEYEVPGVNQTQVHPEIGLTFAHSLRAVLRQDPDVIMVGEIRDRETADIAIRASLTGHLVMSTLHTNDAPGALTRLVDMDIEPFLIASSVEMIIAQRLVRRLCPNCAQPANYDEMQVASFLATMRIDPSEAQHAHLAKSPVGCERCRKLGFRGRVGMFEILRVTEEIHEHIVKRDSARLIRQTAISQDMRSLMDSGWAHIKAGVTTFEEVMRFAELEGDED